jgi:hypothetical protein
VLSGSLLLGFIKIILQKIGGLLLRLDAVEGKAAGGEIDVKPRHVILGKPLKPVLGADAKDVGGIAKGEGHVPRGMIVTVQYH